MTTTPVTTAPLLLDLQPSRAAGPRDLPALETTFASLALDERSPIALELAATATTRHFLARADRPLALRSLGQQLQARYPQAQITPASADPLALAPTEECSVLELRAGAGAAFPLRSWKPRELLAEGTDPLLGILAACGSLPLGMRAVVQLALLPAAPTWSAPHRRAALVQAQANARALRESTGYSGSNGGRSPGRPTHSLKDVALLLPVVVLVLAFNLFHRLLPTWLLQAAGDLLRGQAPQVSLGETIAVALGAGIVFAVLLAGIVLVLLLLNRFGSPRLDDPRLMEEKTARPAYRVRLRVFVFAPGDAAGTRSSAGSAASPQQFLQRLQRLRLSGLASVHRVHRLRWFRQSHPRARRERVRLRVRRPTWQDIWHQSQHLWRTLYQTLWRQSQHLWRTCQRVCQRAQHLCREIWQQQRTRWHTRSVQAQARRARREEREEVLLMLFAAYRQYHLATGGYFVPRHLSARHTRRLLTPLSPPATPSSSARGFLRRRTGWSADLARSSHLLSVADLAALWHLPQAQDLPDLVYVERRSMRTLLAPAILSTVAGYPLGVSLHAGARAPVTLPFACLQQNMLAAASTGKGKSSLFYHVLRAFALGRLQQRSEVPDGALLIDPHGDLVDLVAGALPTELADDVLVIDLADRLAPLAFNPLDMSGGTSGTKDRDKQIGHLIAVIEALWPTSYGPRTESFLEYGGKTLAEANLSLLAEDPAGGPDRQYTLLDIVPLFRDTSFRNTILERVHDPHLLSWWHQYYDLLDGRQQADFTSSLITKLSKFAASRVLRRILGQPRSSLDLGEIIQQNKIVLFSCAAGEVGADMAALFGSLLVGFFQAALQEQGRLHPSERHRFLILIDEFQMLAGINYQTMLAELRKYGGRFALATQSLAYLDRFDRTLRATVLANIEHVFAFAMADEDARLLRLPGVEPEDVTQLPDYTCYTRLSLFGERLPVFSLHLDAPIPGDPALAHDLRARSRARYTRPVGEVDQLLQEGQARREEASPGPWSGVGVETVAEIAERIRRRKRGSGTSRKSQQDSQDPQDILAPQAPQDTTPEHVMYEDVEGDR